MAKTAVISLRVDPVLKDEAEEVFGRFGLTIADAINVFLHKSVMEGGLPFEVPQPRYGEETERAMAEARDIMAGKVEAKRYRSAAEAFGVTAEQLDAWEEDASRGVFHGEPREVVMGRPRIADEPLRAVTVTLPESMIASIDARTKNRSDFIRRAVAACL